MILKDLLKLMKDEYVILFYFDGGHDEFTSGMCKNFNDDFLNVKVTSLGAAKLDDGTLGIAIWTDVEKKF